MASGASPPSVEPSSDAPDTRFMITYTKTHFSAGVIDARQSFQAALNIPGLMSRGLVKPGVVYIFGLKGEGDADFVIVPRDDSSKPVRELCEMHKFGSNQLVACVEEQLEIDKLESALRRAMEPAHDPQR